MYACHTLPSTSMSSTRVSAPSTSSIKQSSTLDATSEKSAKFTPVPSNVAPSGYGLPGHMSRLCPCSLPICSSTTHSPAPGYTPEPLGNNATSIILTHHSEALAATSTGTMRSMRREPSVLHLDLDAFFASVEQRDKPSLRGKPVVVGGLGQRGVVATASYEARVFGVRSAMPMHEARRRCPHAAFLAGRFGAYRAASRQVMDVLHRLSPLVEPLSLDEAFVDLRAATTAVDFSRTALELLISQLKDEVQATTNGLSASVGVATSKLVAKVASELV